jgi:hypothetical protein
MKRPAPGLGVFSPLIDCWKPVFRREGDDLLLSLMSTMEGKHGSV